MRRLLASRSIHSRSSPGRSPSARPHACGHRQACPGRGQLPSSHEHLRRSTAPPESQAAGRCRRSRRFSGSEAVTSHSPVNPKRHAELRKLLTGFRAGLVYVTAFMDRKTLSRFPIIHSFGPTRFGARNW
ncbi:BsuBI/PstI family type II restriction endonuclease [Vitiosangium sp. GDMCC 1.1324]|uniref:BsuBI/PstI family type II restriction endonuclease n=1 Tax=Vitiosangium sp. (strain GDMCC 1.1324) TaxID=2138576 RepID=UPI000D3706A8|nr:hypothetical protein DAT35_31220 [Vitiosangium sp. GDMCC 1.1324]